MLAMNEWKKKCVGLQWTWVSKRTVYTYKKGSDEVGRRESYVLGRVVKHWNKINAWTCLDEKGSTNISEEPNPNFNDSYCDEEEELEQQQQQQKPQHQQ